MTEHDDLVEARIDNAKMMLDHINDRASTRDVVCARARQILTHGYTRDKDDAHTKRQLVRGAFLTLEQYLGAARDRSGRTEEWPENWQPDSPWHQRMKKKSPREKLVMAAALLLAEIDRIDRAIESTDQLDREIEQSKRERIEENRKEQTDGD